MTPEEIKNKRNAIAKFRRDNMNGYLAGWVFTDVEMEEALNSLQAEIQRADKAEEMVAVLSGYADKTQAELKQKLCDEIVGKISSEAKGPENDFDVYNFARNAGIKKTIDIVKSVLSDEG